jgi:hypothetical protein
MILGCAVAHMEHPLGPPLWRAQALFRPLTLWQIQSAEQSLMILDGTMDFGQRLGIEIRSHVTFARP